MSLARTCGVVLCGIAGQLVDIEADVSAGVPGMFFTGLADTAVVESRERIRSAVVNSGATWPNRRVTVALLPADVPKAGSRFDLALALAILAASEQVPVGAVDQVLWLAELGLDGRLRPVRGVLPAVLAAASAGIRRVVVARANAVEAALADPTLDVRCADTVGQVIEWLTGRGPALDAVDPDGSATAPDPDGEGGPDLAEVAGQHYAKRALAIAAAGGHHLYLVGAPGAGKTMLAQRLPGLLPELDRSVALEVTAVHSIAGRLGENTALIRRAPFEAPHHSASRAALVGGGSGLGRPGAVSLAHGGTLFLDEVPEFAPSVLDALRQPLEDGTVTLHRSGGAVSYPARFQLVLAANPCPCGKRPTECTCTAQARRRYVQRLSGPLLDRIDLRLDVAPVTRAELFGLDDPGDPSAVVAASVAQARAVAAARWAELGWSLNAHVPGPVLRSARWALPHSVVGAALDSLERGWLSARGFDRVLRLTWTIADLAGHTVPTPEDLAEALYLRLGEFGLEPGEAA